MALAAAEAAAAGVLRWVAKGLEFILSAVAGMFAIRCICLKWMRFLLVCLHYGKRGPIRWAKLGLQSVMARSQIGLIRAGLAVDSAECKPIRSWLGLLFGGQGRP
jgi:hypothetical protein